MIFSKVRSVVFSAFHYVGRFGRPLLVLFGLTFLAAFLTSMHSRPAAASSSGNPTVTIANTPLPVVGNVNATVSGPVAISGTPSVNAAQSGAWTVGISGTPTVNLGNAGTLSVTASGDPSSSAFTPVSATGASSSFTGNACYVHFTNPASTGQILVIENVGATIGLATGQRVASMQIDGKSQQNQWMPTYQADDGTFAYFGAAQAMRFYMRAGDDPVLAVLANTTNATGNCVFSYSGYVVNVH